MSQLDLNAKYRDEGWGLITDAAFNGRLHPVDVESQAREVARYAFARLSSLMQQINDQAKELAKQDAELKRLAEDDGKAARLRQEVARLKADKAARLLQSKLDALDLAHERRARADLEMRIAEAELILVRYSIEEGVEVSGTLDAEQISRWISNARRDVEPEF